MMQASRNLPRGKVSAGVLIWNDVASGADDDFYRWHNGEHMPERMEIPGFIRGRRYASDGRSPRWFTIYEAASMQVLTSPAYLDRLNNPTEGTRKALPMFRNTARSVCQLQRAVGHAVGGHALVLRFDARSQEVDNSVARELALSVLERVEGLGGVISTSLYGADVSASRIDTAESKTRTFDVPRLTLLIETSHRPDAQTATTVVQQADWRSCGLALRQEHGLYGLEVCFS